MRDRSIDAARGVALFLVALSHAHHIPHYLTSFYIMAFFFLSGYLYKPGRSYGENIEKKTKRVLLPYFTNSVILLLIYALSRHFNSGQIEDAIKGILYSRNYIVYTGFESPVMGGIANNPLWYLTAFFTTSLLFHLVVDRFTESWGNVCLLSILLISVSIGLNQLPILLPWSIDMIPFFTVIMLAGYMFRKEQISLNMSWHITLVMLTGYVFFCYENGSINLSIRNFGWGGQISSLVIGICGTLVCISICKKEWIQLIKEFYVKIGTNSIFILSFHLMFIGIVRAFSRHFILTVVRASVEGTYVYDLIIVIVTMLICILIGNGLDYLKNLTHSKITI